MCEQILWLRGAIDIGAQAGMPVLLKGVIILTPWLRRFL